MEILYIYLAIQTVALVVIAAAMIYGICKDNEFAAWKTLACCAFAVFVILLITLFTYLAGFNLVLCHQNLLELNNIK